MRRVAGIAAAVVAVLSALACSFLIGGRYEIRSADRTPYWFVRLDRLTGEVVVCTTSCTRRLELGPFTYNAESKALESSVFRSPVAEPHR